MRKLLRIDDSTGSPKIELFASSPTELGVATPGAIERYSLEEATTLWKALGQFLGFDAAPRAFVAVPLPDAAAANYAAAVASLSAAMEWAAKRDPLMRVAGQVRQLGNDVEVDHKRMAKKMIEAFDQTWQLRPADVPRCP